MINRKQTTPDQVINQGLCVLCILVGAIISMILQLAMLPSLAGAALGLVVGLILSKFRPQYGEEKGLWKHINHFILTQMDLSSAFKKINKLPTSGCRLSLAPRAQGDAYRYD